jgi:hypothetical protein
LIEGFKESETFRKGNLSRLALVSAFLTAIDTFQSYYGQRVVNTFSEANLIPLHFYSMGAAGYLLYAPVEFLVVYGMFLALWVWASYLLWYRRHFSISFLPFRVSNRATAVQTSDLPQK